MSVPAGIDASAPVRAHHEIDITAPVSTVWQLHTDVDAWPAWQTEITAAHLDGPFQPGASFEWTSYGFTVVSTIYAVADGSRVLWGGTSGGITGVHEWVFAETPAGVHVTTDPRQVPARRAGNRAAALAVWAAGARSLSGPQPWPHLSRTRQRRPGAKDLSPRPAKGQD
jgi:Polyketide cyclase / dehydrase and lipid transport